MQAYTTYKLGGPVSELLYSPATYGIDFAARDAPRPRARANPMLAVAGNTLWLLGGVVEVRRALSWCRIQGMRPRLHVSQTHVGHCRHHTLAAWRHHGGA